MPHDRTRYPMGQGRAAGEPLLSFEPRPGAFALATEGAAVSIVCLEGESACVRRAAGDLRADLGAVLGAEPELLDALPAPRTVNRPFLVSALVGTIDANPVFARAEEMGAFDLSRVRSRREAFAIGVAEDVLPGGGAALLVAGSDPRGAVYGIYALSAAAGVSPWRWWADVPVVRRRDIWVSPGTWIGAEPSVRWRGLFLNDEEPCLGGWARRVFGGLNAAFYARFFELVLRLGGNLVWPAMWGKSFDEDDPENPAVAATYGIIIGSSHHEPMCRAHVEWARGGEGPWSYRRNAAVLGEFWRTGAARIRRCERIATLGMRGDGDEASEDGDDPELLHRIIRDQRRILGSEAGGAAIPQAWVVYKEVQGLYDRGFRPPEGVTIVLCDDNWGNLRKIPPAGERQRPDGHGVYYHFDYVGGPRSYKWIDTTQVARSWEQMGLAREAGADRLWIANVGDLKPLERQAEFFLELARNPDAWDARDAAGYAEAWAGRIFGPIAGSRAGAILSRYERLASRRKPELLGPETYSLVAHRETDRVLAEHAALEAEARELWDRVPEEYRSAYLQLVLYPVSALANLHALYAAVARNRLCAAQGRVSAAAWAAEASRLFERDEELSHD
ncbi:MAG: glycosyl hydrolase 115 family protein, partial [Spirochaetaceae bacterium]|nr:glycosyl hydrolase 115 family protein [Spirochaetaceae bacterium]